MLSLMCTHERGKSLIVVVAIAQLLHHARIEIEPLFFLFLVITLDFHGVLD